MKRMAFMGALALSTAYAATAAAYDMSCTKDTEERVIQIVSPGEVGRMCDVRYVRDEGATVLVPYHANNSAEFCRMKADDLVATLTKSGYSCVAGANNTIAEVTTYRETSPSDPAVENANALVAPSGTLSEETPPIEMNATPPAEADDEAVDIEAAVDEPSLDDKMRAILNEPDLKEAARSEASRGPARLTPGASALPDAGARANAVGRLVGAAPDTPQRAAATVTPVGLTIAQPPAEEPVVEHAAAPASSGAAPTAKSAKRTVEDGVRATVMAQVAAWNEGDLDAFMATYEKSDNLKFVSDVNVTKGWSSTMKRYRERYARDGGLGWLTVEKVDVTMADEDFAVVTGRFNHAGDNETSSGVFSLVMRRTEGVWRIIHDHTSADPKAAE